MAATELGRGSSVGQDERFRLEELLGTGGMASVWLASDTLLDRQVAIKVLSDALALDAAYVRRFRREGQVAAGLSHPNLVRVYDLGQEGSRPFLVMEYVAGGTLAQRLAQPEGRSWDPVRLFGELLDALEYIHAAGIVHRDVKPANVLIGADGRARLTDFGIAQPSDASQITRTGMVVGTRQYLAPEVLRGERADTRSDIYSCGVMFAQCLEDPPPAALRTLVRRMTAEDPRQRPQTAAGAAALLPGSVTVAPRGTTAPTRAQRARASTLVRSPTTLTRPVGPALRRGAAALADARPQVSRRGSEIRVRVPRRGVAGLIGALALIVIVIVIASAAGSGGSGRAPAMPAPPGQGAGLSENLRYLDQAIGRATR